MKTCKTIKGFIADGNEEPDIIIEKYSCAIRIGGKNLNFNKLESAFKTKATRTHKEGENKGVTIFEDDMWLYDSIEVIDEILILEHHLEHINKTFLPHLELLRKLKSNGSIMLYCNYTTNRDVTGVEIPLSLLKLHEELNISFGISFDYIG